MLAVPSNLRETAGFFMEIGKDVLRDLIGGAKAPATSSYASVQSRKPAETTVSSTVVVEGEHGIGIAPAFAFPGGALVKPTEDGNTEVTASLPREDMVKWLSAVGFDIVD